MPRPYAVKGRKLKKRRVEEPAPVEEERTEDASDEGEQEGDQIEENVDERRAEEAFDQIPGLPINAPIDRVKRPGVIFVLEKACLEVGKVGKVNPFVMDGCIIGAERFVIV